MRISPAEQHKSAPSSTGQTGSEETPILILLAARPEVAKMQVLVTTVCKRRLVKPLLCKVVADSVWLGRAYVMTDQKKKPTKFK